jgi:hypothetical protein
MCLCVREREYVYACGLLFLYMLHSLSLSLSLSLLHTHTYTHTTHTHSMIFTVDMGALSSSSRASTSINSPPRNEQAAPHTDTAPSMEQNDEKRRFALSEDGDHVAAVAAVDVAPSAAPFKEEEGEKEEKDPLDLVSVPEATTAKDEEEEGGKKRLQSTTFASPSHSGAPAATPKLQDPTVQAHTSDPKASADNGEAHARETTDAGEERVECGCGCGCVCSA